MSMSIRSVSQSIGDAHDEVVSAIQNAVQTLLQDKHLYQSTSVDVASIFSKHIKPHLQSPLTNETVNAISQAPRWTWRLQDDEDALAKFADLANARGMPPSQEFLWRAPDIKIYCSNCERTEPFNFFSAFNALPRNGSNKKYFASSKGVVQVFCLSYLCQSCKQIPEVFLLGRTGAKLTLSGRTPIETTQIPSFIPLSVAKWYSGATLAFNSGQTLAALFMLRTVCEQWCRPFGETSDKSDVLLEKYAQTLPSDFRDRFPSLRSIYGELSEAIHQAKPDEQLFRNMVVALNEHFEARKVFKLLDRPNR